MAPIQFWNGQILFSDGKIAMDPSCCCGNTGNCVCVPNLPDTLYATVEWPTGTASTIQLDLYATYGCGETNPSGTNQECVKFYEGTGVFGAGPGTAIIRVVFWSNCGDGAVNGSIQFDACLGTLTWPDSDFKDAAKWLPLTNFTCNPLYGEYGAAPPSACGPYLTFFLITVTT